MSGTIKHLKLEMLKQILKMGMGFRNRFVIDEYLNQTMGR